MARDKYFGVKINDGTSYNIGKLPGRKRYQIYIQEGCAYRTIGFIRDDKEAEALINILKNTVNRVANVSRFIPGF